MITDHAHDWGKLPGYELSSNGKKVTLNYICKAEAECPAVRRRMFIFATEEIDQEEA